MKVHKKIKEYSNEKLRQLLIEIKEIGAKDSPKLENKSQELTNLIDDEKTKYNTWYDQYCIVLRAIQSEILFRFQTNKI